MFIDHCDAETETGLQPSDALQGCPVLWPRYPQQLARLKLRAGNVTAVHSKVARLPRMSPFNTACATDEVPGILLVVMLLRLLVLRQWRTLPVLQEPGRTQP